MHTHTSTAFPALTAFAAYLAARGRYDAEHMASLPVRFYREEIGAEICSPEMAERLRTLAVEACRAFHHEPAVTGERRAVRLSEATAGAVPQRSPLDTLYVVAEPDRSQPAGRVAAGELLGTICGYPVRVNPDLAPSLRHQTVRDAMRASDPSGLRIFEAHDHVSDNPANRARRAALFASLPGRSVVVDQPEAGRDGDAANPSTPLHLLNTAPLPPRPFLRPKVAPEYAVTWMLAGAAIVFALLALVGRVR